MRVTAKTAERGYGSRWRKARAAYLAEPGNRVCRMRRPTGLLNPRTLRMDGSLELNPRRIGLVVDHIIPHGSCSGIRPIGSPSATGWIAGRLAGIHADGLVNQPGAALGSEQRQGELSIQLQRRP